MMRILGYGYASRVLYPSPAGVCTPNYQYLLRTSTLRASGSHQVELESRDGPVYGVLSRKFLIIDKCFSSIGNRRLGVAYPRYRKRLDPSTFLDNCSRLNRPAKIFSAGGWRICKHGRVNEQYGRFCKGAGNDA